MAVLLYGYWISFALLVNAEWLNSCIVIWLLDFIALLVNAEWLNGCIVIWLLDFIALLVNAEWLNGCIVIWLLDFIALKCLLRLNISRLLKGNVTLTT